jgi:hypothetical protein
MKIPTYIKVSSVLLIFLIVFYFISFFPKQQSQQPQEPSYDQTVFEEEPIETSSSEYGLPSIPVYPKAAYVETKENIEGEDFLYRSNWETEDLVPQVMEWYVNKLSDGEWEIEKFPYDSGMEGKQRTIVSNDDWRIIFEVTQEDIGMLTQIDAKFYQK